LTGSVLANLLSDEQCLRLVVLNSCEGARSDDLDLFSSTAATLVRRGVAAVVAMQYEISDRAAIEFCHAFYESLVDGFPVDAAVSEARKAIELAIENTVEWATPVLYMHAQDGQLFRIATRQRQVEVRRARESTAPEVSSEDEEATRNG